MTAAIDDAEFVRIQVAHRLGSIDDIRLKSTETRLSVLKGATLLLLYAGAHA
ncbi:hypothetical protein [Paracoccus sp. (in: a-proteobacteria)]|uniref:hypothetical protein n=1 Tax=Paracoccus sp. TaxID=267 RepID=UPI0026E09A70|nr:hypothetical protein [Paracoccus sp. (in: a-proteobacteria)]MDO5370435.1 hypothetical protein [Paracoccus sp. (in: a-proteobacteria)]